MITKIIRNSITVMLWLALVGVGVFFYASLAHAKLPAKPKIATSKAGAQNLLVSPTPVTVAPQTVPATETKAPANHKVATVAKPQPVVTPAPTSSVSGLEPVTPPSTSGSSTSTPPPDQPATTTGYVSTNWAGYLSTTGSFTAVSASWNVPLAVGIPSTTSADATWVGIGGVTSGDLVQVGTNNVIDPSGHITTVAFYETLPQASKTITSMTIAEGDSITALVKQLSAGQWLAQITDNTNGQSFSITLAYNSSLSSAEWIEEDPSYSFRRLIPFDDFKFVAFSDASAVVNGTDTPINSSNTLPITLVNKSNTVLAAPSAITTGNNGFSVTRSGL